MGSPYYDGVRWAKQYVDNRTIQIGHNTKPTYFLFIVELATSAYRKYMQTPKSERFTLQGEGKIEFLQGFLEAYYPSVLQLPDSITMRVPKVIIVDYLRYLQRGGLEGEAKRNELPKNAE